MSTTRGPFRPRVSADLALDSLTRALGFALALDDFLKTAESRAAVDAIRAAIVAVAGVVK